MFELGEEELDEDEEPEEFEEEELSLDGSRNLQLNIGRLSS